MAKPTPFRRIQRRSYTDSRYQNPYFSRKSSTIITPWFVGGLFGLLIGIACAFVLLLPNLRIQSVEVTGLSDAQNEHLSARAFEALKGTHLVVIPNRHKWFYEIAAVEDVLQSEIHYASMKHSVNGSVLSIALSEHEYGAVWVTNGSYYLVDLQGLVNRELEDAEQEVVIQDASQSLLFPVVNTEMYGPPSPVMHPLKQLIQIHDVQDVAVDPGDPVLFEEETLSIKRFVDNLRGLDQEPAYLEIDRIAGNWIGAHVPDGYVILFDATGDIPAQTQRLQTILETRTTVLPEEYIDLRFGDHVYIK